MATGRYRGYRDTYMGLPGILYIHKYVYGLHGIQGYIYWLQGIQGYITDMGYRAIFDTGIYNILAIGR